MTDKSLTVIVGEDQDPIQDLTEYVNWEASRFQAQAYNGEAAVSEIVFRDDLSEMGPWTDTDITLAARNEVEVKLGSLFMWRGRLIGRSWQRGIQKANTARVVSAEAEDMNGELNGLIVDQWVRPVETDVERVQALSEFLDGSVRVGADIDLTTYVPNTNTVTLAAKTYTQTTPRGVLDDIITQSHKMFFVTLDKELFYDKWDSAAYDSGLRITEDIGEHIADADGTLVIIPDSGALFKINGQQYINTVRVVYGPGPNDWEAATDPAMADVKAHWAETVYAPDTITTAGEALELAALILAERSQDGRTFQLSVRHSDGGSLTEAQVALIQPGRLIKIKSHVLPLATYSDYDTRIVSVQWHMPLPGQFFATLKLEKPERKYGVGNKPGPRPPREASGVGCDALIGSELSSIDTPNGDVGDGAGGDGTHWTGGNVVEDPPSSNTFLYQQAFVGGNTMEYAGWSGYTFLSGTRYVVDFHGSGSGTHNYRFGVQGVDYGEEDGPDVSPGADEHGLGPNIHRLCWTPSANRAGVDVALRLGRATTGATQGDSVQAYVVVGQQPEPIGGDSEADPGTDTSTQTPFDHVHPHGNITTGGPYHMAEDVTSAPFGTITATNVQDALEEVLAEAGGGVDLSGIDFLVGTASGDLSAEIAVGTTPGGELGGTWASPTVDATHSGSAHHTESHQARHANGGADEVPVEGLATAEMDVALVLHPDGAGGIEWGTDEGGGSGIAGELITDTFAGDGAEDTFTLSEAPTGSWALVTINGAHILPTEYVITGGDIVFDTPPDTDAEVLVTFITGGFTSPATDPGDIADPTLATAEDVALKLNALMAELRTAGIIA